VIWPYLSWLERVSFLAVCILGIYWFFSAATVLRFRSTSGKLNPASVQENLASIRNRLKNLHRATVAAFYFLGFVLFAGLLSDRHCPGFDVAGLVAATRVSLPLTNTFMEFSVSPDSSVYS
jgi:hypothetical protein